MVRLLAYPLDEFENEVNQNFRALEEQQIKLINHAKVMKRKIFHANKIQEQIKMFENSPGYRNEVDIQKECKVTEDILSSAVKVANDLLALENDPCFLNEDQMKLLEDHVSINF